MQLHQLKPKHKLKKRKRVGRGGKRGTYSGRGIKGQRSRAGRKFKPVIRELIKRYPKLRGYKFKRQKPFRHPSVVSLDTLEKRFKATDTITPKVLIEKGLIHRIGGRLPKVKILGQGRHSPTTQLTKKLTIEGCQVSKQAKEKIEKAGGSVK